jgi:hypothetical protein
MRPWRAALSRHCAGFEWDRRVACRYVSLAGFGWRSASALRLQFECTRALAPEGLLEICTPPKGQMLSAKCQVLKLIAER